jgi:hypothetical protein
MDCVMPLDATRSGVRAYFVLVQHAAQPHFDLFVFGSRACMPRRVGHGNVAAAWACRRRTRGTPQGVRGSPRWCLVGPL